MTTRYDLLDQYIDARNAGNGAGFDVSDDPELARLLDTVDRLDDGESIEWPGEEFPSRMASNLSNELSPFPRVHQPEAGSDGADNVTELHGGGEAGPLQAEQRGSWYWVRQLGGMAAAALVVVLFAGGLALIFESWDDGMQPGGAMVEPGDLPGTLVYVEYDSQEQEQVISRINADGTDQSDLATRPSPRAQAPGVAVSPDGEWIAYFMPDHPNRDSPAEIRFIRTDGSESHAVGIGPIHGTLRLDTHLNWSDDSNTVAFVYYDREIERTRIGVVYPDSGEFRTVESDLESTTYNDSHPDWAPEQWALAFARNQGEGQRSIQVLREGMSEPTPVVEGEARATQPEWSPNGESIVYIGSSKDGERANVHVVDVDSGQTRNITNHEERWDYSPTWSSRGQIAFMSDQGDRNYDIFVVGQEGSDLRNITEDYEWRVYQPDWSDDGRYLTFTSSNEDQTRWRLNVYDIETNEFFTVLESENPLHHAMWQPSAEDPPLDEEQPATPAFELSEEERERERAIAQAMLEESENNTPALEVNGEVITAGRFGLSLAAVESNLAFMQGSEQADSIDDPEAQAFFAEHRFLIEETGVENVALGSLLAEVVTVQWGLDNGHGVSQEEIDAMIEQQRNNIDDRAATYTEVIGEDRYWNELYPKMLERTMIQQNVRAAILTDAGEDTRARPEREFAIFNEFQTGLLNEAEIEILDREAVHNADLDMALEYITEAYPALQEEYALSETGQDGEHDLILPDDAALPDGESAVAAAREYAEEEGTELGEIRQARMMSPRDADEIQGMIPPEYIENNTPIWRVEFGVENGSSVFWMNAIDGNLLARGESGSSTVAP